MSVITKIFIINIIILASLTNLIFRVMKDIEKDSPEVADNHRFKLINSVIASHAVISALSVPFWGIYVVATS